MARYNKHDREMLKENAKKHLNTTMIGALDILEQAFGYLWGHGKHKDSLTENEKRFRRLWSSARRDILDNGNDECRALLEEIDMHDVSKNKYHYDFKIMTGEK